MADNGKLYPAFDSKFPKLMANVCSKADIIVPNLTEACLMTDTEYKTEYDEKYIMELLHNLTAMGAKKAAITGANYNGKYGIVGYDSEIIPLSHISTKNFLQAIMERAMYFRLCV